MHIPIFRVGTKRVLSFTDAGDKRLEPVAIVDAPDGATVEAGRLTWPDSPLRHNADPAGVLLAAECRAFGLRVVGAKPRRKASA